MNHHHRLTPSEPRLHAEPAGHLGEPTNRDDRPWPNVRERGIDTDLVAAIAHTRRACNRALDPEDWTISAYLMTVLPALLGTDVRANAAASALDVQLEPLAGHLRHALEAIDRYLLRHPQAYPIQSARDDLLRCYRRATV